MTDYILSINPAVCLLVGLVILAAWAGAYYTGRSDQGMAMNCWRFVLMTFGIFIGASAVFSIVVSLIACIIKAAYA